MADPNDLTGEQREALDNWLMLAALREAYEQVHTYAHAAEVRADIDFAVCHSWVCRRNREKLIGWGCDVVALSGPKRHDYRPSSDLIGSPCALCRQRPDEHDDYVVPSEVQE